MTPIFPIRALPDLAADPWNTTTLAKAQDWLLEYGGWTRANLTAAVCQWPENMGCRLLWAAHQETMAERIERPRHPSQVDYIVPGRPDIKPTPMRDRNPDYRGGAARAEFVRVSVELEEREREVIARPITLPQNPLAKRVDWLLRRQHQLFTGPNAQMWCGLWDLLGATDYFRTDGWGCIELYRDGQRICEHGFRRGFLESLALPAEQWLRHADTLIAEHPIRECRLTDDINEHHIPYVREGTKYYRYIIAGQSFTFHEREIKSIRGGLPEMRRQMVRQCWPNISFTFPQPGWHADPAAATPIADLRELQRRLLDVGTSTSFTDSLTPEQRAALLTEEDE